MTPFGEGGIQSSPPVAWPQSPPRRSAWAALWPATVAPVQDDLGRSRDTTRPEPQPHRVVLARLQRRRPGDLAANDLEVQNLIAELGLASSAGSVPVLVMMSLPNCRWASPGPVGSGSRPSLLVPGFGEEPPLPGRCTCLRSSADHAGRSQRSAHRLCRVSYTGSPDRRPSLHAAGPARYGAGPAQAQPTRGRHAAPERRRPPRRSARSPWRTADVAQRARATIRLREALGAERFATEFAAGQALSFDTALTSAIDIARTTESLL